MPDGTSPWKVVARSKRHEGSAEVAQAVLDKLWADPAQRSEFWTAYCKRVREALAKGEI